MGELNKEQDLEKGEAAMDAPRPSIGGGITSFISKAGGELGSAITKAGEGLEAAGTTLQDKTKSEVTGPGGATKTPQKLKKNPQRAKDEKKFHKNFKPISREHPKDTNVVGNITKLLPANTFLMFQTLAPLTTNDGKCGRSEIIMTIAMLFILGSACMMVCFTDTIQFNGKVYQGLVTWSGLWNPSFKGDPSLKDLRLYEHELAKFYEARKTYKAEKREPGKEGQQKPQRPVEPPKPVGPYLMGSTYSSGNSQYELSFTDFLHAVLTLMAFATLTMLTSPVSTCFYPNIPSTVVKTLPLLVGFVVSAIFAFSPPARNGIAHPLSPKVPSQLDNYKPPDPKGVVHGPSLPPQPPGKGDHDHAMPKADDHDGLVGRLEKDEGKPGSTPPEHSFLSGLMALGSGLLSDDMKHVAAKTLHSLEGDAMNEASHVLHNAAPAVAELSKDIPIQLALQEAVKSVPHDELVAGLVNAGAHPTLAIAAVQSAAQGAKDAASKQLQRQVSGLSPNVHAPGSEAALVALATGQALMHAGYQLPGASQSPQAAALSTFAPNVGNNFNLNSANALMKDATSLGQQGDKSLAEVHNELAQQGTQGVSNAKAELLKRKEVLPQEMTSQARALSTPATSVAHDPAALVTGSHPTTVSDVNSQFVQSLARGVAQGMAHAGSQPPASVAIDVASLGSQLQAQLSHQASALSPEMYMQLSHQASSLSPQVQAAAAMLQRQASFGQFQQQPSVVDTHMALRHLASQLSPPAAAASPEFGGSQVMSGSPPSWRDNASVNIEEVTDAGAAVQRGVDRLQRGASQLPSVTEEVGAQATARVPSASQVQTASSGNIASTSEAVAAGQAALIGMTHILRSDRPESTEIVDPISTEEITSEPETELSNRGGFRAGGSNNFNLQGSLKRKL